MHVLVQEGHLAAKLATTIEKCKYIPINVDHFCCFHRAVKIRDIVTMWCTIAGGKYADNFLARM
jgi:hypothetical protein